MKFGVGNVMTLHETNFLGFGGGRWAFSGLPREITCQEVPPKMCQEPKKEVPKSKNENEHKRQWKVKGQSWVGCTIRHGLPNGFKKRYEKEKDSDGKNVDGKSVTDKEHGMPQQKRPLSWFRFGFGFWFLLAGCWCCRPVAADRSVSQVSWSEFGTVEPGQILGLAGCSSHGLMPADVAELAPVAARFGQVAEAEVPWYGFLGFSSGVWFLSFFGRFLFCVGTFPSWFFPWDFPTPRPRGVVSARWVGCFRVVKARKGWKRRHDMRVFFVSQYGVPFDVCSRGRMRNCTFVGFSWFYFCRPKPAVEHPSSCERSHTPPSWFHFGNCRGGARGSNDVTDGKSHEQLLLKGLQDLLNAHAHAGSPTGVSKPPNSKGKGTGNSNVPKLATDVGLLQALKRLVQRASKKPEGLLNRLQSLVSAAATAADRGQQIHPKKKKKDGGKTSVRSGSGGSSEQKGKGKGKSGQGKQSVSSPGTELVSDVDHSWVQVVRKGQKKGNTKGKAVDNNMPFGRCFQLRDLDWPKCKIVHKIDQFGSFLDRDGYDKHYVLLTSSHQELANVLELIHGDSRIRASVFLPCKKTDEIQVDGFPLVKFKVSNYPVSDQFGKVQTKILAGWSNVQRDDSQVKLVVPSQHRPKARTETQHSDTTVLRFKAEKKFCSSKVWSQVTSQPGTSVRKWISGVAPGCRNSIQDTWGWELQPGSQGAHTVVKGLVRMKKGDGITHILTGSGRSFEGLRCFVDPLKWEDCPWNRQPYVSWVEKAEEESDSDYAARTARMANMGIAKGWVQLGIRTTQDPGEQKSQSKTWILRSAPRHWNMEGVESFLIGAGFSHIEFTSKKLEKFGTSWFFKGSRAGTQDYLQLLFEGNDFSSEGKFLVVERLQRSFKPSQVKLLKHETRVSLYDLPVEIAPIDLDQESEEDNHDVPPTAMDTQEGEEDADLASTGGQKRGPDAGTSPEKKKKKSEAQPLPKGVERLVNDGNGDCLFLSIAQGLKESGGGDHHHRSVRAAAVAHMRKHVQKYFLFWDHKNTDDSDASDTTINGFQKYINDVSKIGAWSGNLEIAALAATLDRPITVVHEKGQIFHFNPEDNRKNLFLYYSPTAGHYECLKVPNEVQLSLRTKALPGQTKGGRKSCRGGMDSLSLGGHTRKTTSLKSLSLGGRTAKTRIDGDEAKSVGGVTAKTKVTDKNQGSIGGHTRAVKQRTKTGSAGSTKDPVFSTKEPGVPAASSSSAAPYHYGPQEMWTCPFCGFVITPDPTKCPMFRRRRNHITQRHPDQAGNKLFHMREYCKVVEATDQLPQEQIDWVCVWCGKALPLLHKHLKSISVTHHMKTKHPRRDTSAAASNAQRAKLARRNDPRVSNYLKGKKTLGQKLRQKYGPETEIDHVGHVFKEFQTRQNWPIKKHLLHKHDDVHLTCVKCRLIRFRGKLLKLSPCKGLSCPPSQGAQQLWKKFETCPENKKVLCKVWGITLNVADAWFEPKTKGAGKRKKGHKFLKRPANRAKVWKRNLCEDGDIESQPGPVSNIEVWTLNVQGPRGAWALIDYVQTIKDTPLIIGLQETRLSSREFAAWSRSAVRAGFRVFGMDTELPVS